MTMRRGTVLLPLLAAAALCLALPAEAQTWRTMTSARQVQDREPIDARIQYGAGTLRISPADTPMLYEMEIRYDEESSTPLAEFDQNRRRLRLGARTAEMNRRGINIREESSASIRLTREVPLDLELQFGAGRAEIELGGLSLQRLSISTGASETTIGFNAPNLIAAERIEIKAGAADLRITGLGNARAARIEFEGGVGATVLDFSGATGDMRASVKMGVGSVTLRLPRTHGVRMNRSSFLTSFTAPELTRQGDAYYSGNWSSAEQRLTIDVSAALGAVTVEWVE